MLAGEGLIRAQGRAREFSNGKPTVDRRPLRRDQGADRRLHDDPGGSRQEALDWIRRWPASDAGGNVELELRQVFEAEDFGAEFTPELRATEERLRAELDQRAERRGQAMTAGCAIAATRP